MTQEPSFFEDGEDCESLGKKEFLEVDFYEN